MRQLRSRPRRHCRGAFAIMTVPALIVMVALTGLALDTALLYNRKVELAGMARAAALAAARKLDGTAAGIAAAREAARVTATRYTYNYGVDVAWNDAALAFSNGPSRDGAWLGVGGVANPASLHYVKVDTNGLDAGLGAVRTTLMQVFSQALRTVSDSAIAGRAGIRALPLAVCAMSDQAASARTNTDLADTELVEYGFRRGVSYDLMNLNPKGIKAARYAINPVVAPGATGDRLNPAILGPFVCTGTMWMPRVEGGAVRVSVLDDTLPLAGLVHQLNSRFGDYTENRCHASGAPPDTNVYQYRYPDRLAPWMLPAQGLRSALDTIERGRLETVADIPPPGSIRTDVTAGSFGPLWSFAKAVKFASWSAAMAAGRTDYETFPTTDWPKLYRAGISSVNYPSRDGTPYLPLGTSNPPIAAPIENAHFATQYRRLLYVPLLACEGGAPTGADTPATVAAVGKFFMTVPAASDSLVAEFAGIAAPQTIPATVELYP